MPDRLQLRIGPTYEGAYCGDTVDLFINDRNLIEMVREIELPFVQAEGHPDGAGHYIGIPSEAAFLPARTFLGDNSQWYVDEDKAGVLRCGCGEAGCWPLLVKITLESDSVIWSDFEQPHRPEWRYEGLGPFRFDRAEYEAALQGPQQDAGG